MEISHIKSISKILTDLCVTRQRVKKNNFASIVYNVLVVVEHK